ncbi:MAG: glycosyltransferase family 4 protein [bacterium]|nr:glycosyltransferase family 4 protein [bacterium]
MKICFLAGANSVHSKRWIKYFAERGHEIHWLSLAPSTEGNIENVRLYLIKELPGFSPLNILHYLSDIKRLIKKIKPDILHVHYAGLNGMLGALTGFHPFVLTAWGSDVLIAGKSMIKKTLVKFALTKADLITCDANHMIEAMTKLGIDNKKINLIYFGVEADKFKPQAKNEDLLARWGVNDSPVIISLRSLEPIYDIETLIRSIPYVLKEFPKARFVIAGAGSSEEYLKRLDESTGVMDSVRFIGRYSNDELPTYLASSDVYVSTSLSDAGIAASTAEAMAAGVPVVITNSGENKEWIKDGENGFIVPVKRPEVIAEKIIYLLANEALRRRIGQEGRKTIEEKNNYYREMEKMEKLYRELVGHSICFCGLISLQIANLTFSILNLKC